jgi:hypothetical protein
LTRRCSRKDHNPRDARKEIDKVVRKLRWKMFSDFGANYYVCVL